MTLKTAYIHTHVYHHKSTTLLHAWKFADFNIRLIAEQALAAKAGITLLQLTNLKAATLRKTFRETLEKQTTSEDLVKMLSAAKAPLSAKDKKDVAWRSVRFNLEQILKQYGSLSSLEALPKIEGLALNQVEVESAVKKTYLMMDTVMTAADITVMFTSLNALVNGSTILAGIFSHINNLEYGKQPFVEVSMKWLLPMLEADDTEYFKLSGSSMMSEVSLSDTNFKFLDLVNTLERLGQINVWSGNPPKKTSTLTLTDYQESIELFHRLDSRLLPLTVTGASHLLSQADMQLLLRVFIIKELQQYKSQGVALLPAHIKENDLLPGHRATLDLMHWTIGTFRRALSSFCSYLFENLKAIVSMENKAVTELHTELVSTYFEHAGSYQAESRAKYVSLLAERFETNLNYVQDTYKDVFTKMLLPMELPRTEGVISLAEREEMRKKEWTVSPTTSVFKIGVKKHTYTLGEDYWAFTEWPGRIVALKKNIVNTTELVQISDDPGAAMLTEDLLLADYEALRSLIFLTDHFQPLANQLVETGIAEFIALTSVTQVENMLGVKLMGTKREVVEKWLKGKTTGIRLSRAIIVLKLKREDGVGPMFEVATDDFYQRSDVRLCDANQFSVTAS